MDLAEKQAGVYQLFDRILANHALLSLIHI